LRRFAEVRGAELVNEIIPARLKLMEIKMKRTSKILVALAITALMTGSALLAFAGDSGSGDGKAAAGEKDSCKSKDGCKSKDECKSKDSCKSKDGCSAKDDHGHDHDKH
jgi:hypothetical protein